MATSYVHGIRTIEDNTGTRPSAPKSTEIIGLVGTAPDADATLFPLGEPVLFTNIYSAINNVGATGTLLANLEEIHNQVLPRLVIVRVAEGADDAETRANAVAGITLLETADSRLGVTPKILTAGFLDDDLAVANALASAAQKLNGFAYATASGATLSEAVLYRDNFAQREIELLWPNPMGLDTATGAIVEKPAAALAAGMRAKIDAEQGWHHPISNLPVNGVVALSHDVSWSLTDSSNDAAVLNEAQITTFASRGGFRLWGLRTCASDPLFAFETTVRSGQAIREIIADTLSAFMDKPMNVQLIRDIIATINAELRRRTAVGHLVGGRAWYEIEANEPSQLKGGKLVIHYDYTPVPPLEDLTLVQKITDKYLTEYAVILSN
ncbi:phage tail sheath subtilisin-like domain-containing protein [Ostreibacterium oceani]|uniref:Phage tail protein n=1 Tax=Ostreibacterium oceani TaxID=2654998 RepID=A0A6N7F0I1_9GAMM|nr:phage tail sheath subtilisin-like domain-containing protein [Ostreibacterium oceani]MPV86907.1 phage tail protein [Ostreibacterium oceani]